MTRYQDALNELDDSLGEYIRLVGEFQYRNEPFVICDHYITDTHETCEVDGHYPIREVFLIRNVKKDEILKVGNKCIDSITNKKIARWFRSHTKKRRQLIKNKDRIEKLGEMVKWEWISEIGRRRLKRMLDRLCKGLKPTKSQQRLCNYYIEHQHEYE